MKHGLTWAVVLTLAAAVTSPSTTAAATNGVILISTRFAQDSQTSTEYVTAEWGPGMVTPGDVAMGNLLADNGYSFRLVLDRLLEPVNAQAWGQDPAIFTEPTDPNLAPMLIILSGSSASAD